eukprot:TRINITY_DN121508_c0_g1_i1.p1 TRINITY_DN121508_c0_g1~~TRINITY_DN121508_c0_g1_i1.p1  ORF type:complete len:441 (-),score=40.01 TRINITY_DN121508_c0_g1_i1:39-1361(-)
MRGDSSCAHVMRRSKLQCLTFTAAVSVVLSERVSVSSQAGNLHSLCDGDEQLAVCLSGLSQLGLGSLGTLRELVTNCGEENPLLDLLDEPQRYEADSLFRQLLRASPPAEERIVTQAIRSMRGHAKSLWRILVDLAYGCATGEQCASPGQVRDALRARHSDYLLSATSLLQSAAEASASEPWIASIGDPAQIVARQAFNANHVDLAGSLISGLDTMDQMAIISVLNDLVMRVSTASCELQAELLAHFTIKGFKRLGAPWPQIIPRFEFRRGLGTRRYNVLAKLVEEVKQDHAPLRVVEIGVNNALTSEYLLGKFPDMEYDGVDPFIDAAAIHKEASARFARFAGRARLWQATSEQASVKFAPGSLDLVFIDGDHSRDAVVVDVKLWRPLLRPGGILAGHDLFNPAFEGVLLALHELLGSDTDENMPTVYFAPDYVWWLYV